MIEIQGYTQKELDFIQKNFTAMTLKNMAKELNKSVNSVTYASKKLGLIKQKHTKWTDNDIQYLKDNYIEQTSTEIAKILGKTMHSVNAMRDKLGLVRHENWCAEDVDFLIDNFEFMTHAEIGEKLGRTEQAVRAKCFDLDLYKKERPWEDWEFEFVRNNYMEMDKRKIADKLGRTPNAIQVKARRMGLKKSPYTCDYHFFDNIDSEEKAYWLGFLTADGWINLNPETHSGTTGVEIQYGDIDHLRKFNKALRGNYQITDRWRPCILSSPTKKNHTCCLRIFSLTMYESLTKLGFTNKKSFDATIPKLNSKLLRHFIRGYFDGDGCFSFTEKAFSVNFITASKTLYSDLTKFLKQQGLHYSQYRYFSEYHTQMYTISINRKQDKIKFLDYIYKDCSVYLTRKYKKYLRVKETMTAS